MEEEYTSKIVFELMTLTTIVIKALNQDMIV